MNEDIAMCHELIKPKKKKNECFLFCSFVGKKLRNIQWETNIRKDK